MASVIKVAILYNYIENAEESGTLTPEDALELVRKVPDMNDEELEAEIATIKKSEREDAHQQYLHPSDSRLFRHSDTPDDLDDTDFPFLDNDDDMFDDLDDENSDRKPVWEGGGFIYPATQTNPPDILETTINQAANSDDEAIVKFTSPTRPAIAERPNGLDDAIADAGEEGFNPITWFAQNALLDGVDMDDEENEQKLVQAINQMAYNTSILLMFLVFLAATAFIMSAIALF